MTRLQHFLFLGFIGALVVYALIARRAPSVPPPGAADPVAAVTVSAAALIQQAAVEEAATQERIRELGKLESAARSRTQTEGQTFKARTHWRDLRQTAWNSILSTNWDAFQALRRKAAQSPHHETPCTICDGHGFMDPCVLCHDPQGKCQTCAGAGKRFGETCATCLGNGKCFLCYGGGKMPCVFCDDGQLSSTGPVPRKEMPVHAQELAQTKPNSDDAEAGSQALSTVSAFIQKDDSIHQALLEEQKQMEANLPNSFGQEKREHLLLGLTIGLVALLTFWVLARHKREAEIRVLTGKYLADGLEAAHFRMPSLFDSPLPPVEKDVFLEDEIDEGGDDSARKLLNAFFTSAPDLLTAMRKSLSDLAKAIDEASRREELVKLREYVVTLKSGSNCWDLRPVWQMSSALDLLIMRLSDKCKEVTPSTIRTMASAVDLLGDLCVPGVRPDLIINPPISVLAVDDDPLCLRAVVFALQKGEMSPDTATTGEEAVARAREKAYDVVFMDIQMPGIDGMEACSQLQETEKNANTPCIFVTVKSDFHTRAQTILKGGSDLLAKPFLVLEVTVKAITYAMRKRLLLSSSDKNERSAVSASADAIQETRRSALKETLEESKRDSDALLSQTLLPAGDLKISEDASVAQEGARQAA